MSEEVKKPTRKRAVKKDSATDSNLNKDGFVKGQKLTFEQVIQLQKKK